MGVGLGLGFNADTAHPSSSQAQARLGLEERVAASLPPRKSRLPRWSSPASARSTPESSAACSPTARSAVSVASYLVRDRLRDRVRLRLRLRVRVRVRDRVRARDRVRVRVRATTLHLAHAQLERYRRQPQRAHAHLQHVLAHAAREHAGDGHGGGWRYDRVEPEALQLGATHCDVPG